MKSFRSWLRRWLGLSDSVSCPRCWCSMAEDHYDAHCAWHRWLDEQIEFVDTDAPQSG